MHQDLQKLQAALLWPLTCDGQHHAGHLVADGVAGDAFVAPAVGRAHVLHLQVTLRADVELSALCHLHTVLQGQRDKVTEEGVTAGLNEPVLGTLL